MFWIKISEIIFFYSSVIHSTKEGKYIRKFAIVELSKSKLMSSFIFLMLLLYFSFYIYFEQKVEKTDQNIIKIVNCKS